MAFYCAKCGKVIETKDKVCRNCGTPTPFFSRSSGKEHITKAQESIPEKSIPEESIPEENIPEESIPEEKEPSESRQNQEEVFARKGVTLGSIAEKTGRAIKERFIPWVRSLDSRVKIVAAAVIALLIIIPLIWWFGFKKPYKEAVEEYDQAAAAYDLEYSSYKDTADAYNKDVKALEKSRSRALREIQSMEKTIASPETDDEELIADIRKKLDGYKAEAEAEPDIGEVRITEQKVYDIEGLKTKEIRALTDEIRSETDKIKIENSKVSDMTGSINDEKYTGIVNDIGTLRNKYDESVIKAKGIVYAPGDAKSMVGKNYSDAADKFIDNGFKNVKTEGIGDIIIGLLHSEGEVKEVTLAGSTEFDTTTQYNENDEVIIRYHSSKKTGLVTYGETKKQR